uniref:Interleukin 17D n=2 Tax=Xenopus tropicalis TaxID=8364 RepID=A0A803JG82_XENTR
MCMTVVYILLCCVNVILQVWMLKAAMMLLFGILIASCNGSKPVKRPPPKPKSCADRPEEHLEQVYGRLAAGMLSAYHHTLQLQPLDKENISCPAGTQGRGAGDGKQRLPVNIHSISPWAYRISYNPTRYPKYIPEAYCLCKGCLTGLLGEEDLNFRSMPVYMPTVILRRTTSCAGGRYVYEEEYITIPVGCTCVPEQEKGAELLESVNSSLEKEKFKLPLNKSEKPLAN